MPDGRLLCARDSKGSARSWTPHKRRSSLGMILLMRWSCSPSQPSTSAPPKGNKHTLASGAEKAARDPQPHNGFSLLLDLRFDRFANGRREGFALLKLLCVESASFGRIKIQKSAARFKVLDE